MKIPSEVSKQNMKGVYDPVDLNFSPRQAIIQLCLGSQDHNHNLRGASVLVLIRFQDTSQWGEAAPGGRGGEGEGKGVWWRPLEELASHLQQRRGGSQALNDLE